MLSAKYTWIQTRDGSPTLWHNEISEPFRSLKGAFSESWAAFVEPALGHLDKLNKSNSLTLGEFGLGIGTNWLIWNLAAKEKSLNVDYFAIERDMLPFEMGLKHWRENPGIVRDFLLSRKIEFPKLHALGLEDLQIILENLEPPRTFESLESAIDSNLKAQLWFHDPFGFEVNPEGYSPESLRKCQKLWKLESFWGGSYACNRAFRSALEGLGLSGLELRVLPTGVPKLKKERLEFGMGLNLNSGQ